MRTKGRLAILLAAIAAFVIALIVLNSVLKPGGGTRSPESGAESEQDTDSLRIAFDAEFMGRPEYERLQEVYDLHFTEEPMQMDPGLMYKAAADGAVDVIDGFATDGRIAAYDLKILKDDKQCFPPYYAAPLIRAEIIEAHPEIKTILEKLGGRIPAAKMQEMNYAVDEKEQKPYDVAHEFLQAEGLLSDATATTGRGAEGAAAAAISVGGKNFTEQELLGEILAIMIEENAGLNVKRNLGLGGTMICFKGLQGGGLDVYAEYTGTGLVNILKKEVIADPDEAYRVVQEEFTERYDLEWLKPFGFNNTYTLTMRREQAEELGIETISDLAEYMKTH